jgi:hypothetical protein
MLFGDDGGATFMLNGGDLLLNSTGAPSVIGSILGNSLVYSSNTTISSFTLQQGTLIIAGRFARAGPSDPPPTPPDASIRFVQSGGTLIVSSVGHTNISRSTFDASAPASSFTMSAGTLVLRNANINTAPARPVDMILPAATTISGGTIQFGDATSSPNQRYNPVCSLPILP